MVEKKHGANGAVDGGSVGEGGFASFNVLILIVLSNRREKQTCDKLKIKRIMLGHMNCLILCFVFKCKRRHLMA